jgi:phosphoserine phosphatase
MNEQTITSRMGKYINDYIQKEEVSRAPDLARRTLATFREADPLAFRRFQEEQSYQAVYALVLSEFHHTRGAGVVQDTLVKAESIERKVTRWDRWREHAGGRHIDLMAMTKDDLLIAAAERRQVAVISSGLAILWETLAEQLSESEAVRDRFTAQDIERISQNVEGKEGIPWESSMAVA